VCGYSQHRVSTWRQQLLLLDSSARPDVKTRLPALISRFFPGSYCQNIGSAAHSELECRGLAHTIAVNLYSRSISGCLTAAPAVLPKAFSALQIVEAFRLVSLSGYCLPATPVESCWHGLFHSSVFHSSAEQCWAGHRLTISAAAYVVAASRLGHSVFLVYSAAAPASIPSTTDMLCLVLLALFPCFCRCRQLLAQHSTAPHQQIRFISSSEQQYVWLPWPPPWRHL
jgi:hypothetical protein